MSMQSSEQKTSLWVDLDDDLAILPFPPKKVKTLTLPDTPTFDFLDPDIEQHPVERTIQSSSLSIGELNMRDNTTLLRALGTKSVQELINGSPII